MTLWGGLSLPQISFFEFRRLISYDELDGLIIAADARSDFAKQVVQTCKLYQIPNVGVIDFEFPNVIHWLEPEKSLIVYLAVDIIDGCNLNCKGCTHFAGLFGKDNVYRLENFLRDVQRLSECCDVGTFRLMGGEPLLLKNLDEYLKISRRYLQKSNLRIATNGLLIPTLPKKILDAIHENDFSVDISLYPPTMKIVDKIKAVLDANEIKYTFMSGNLIRYFFVFMTLHESNNPEKSRQICMNNTCRAMRDGKIYKCPPDAFSYKFAERFGIEGFPQSVGVDIYAPNFSSLLDMLDGNVEMCYWCSERAREIPWQPTNNPKLEDWLADPDELKNFM